MKTHHYWTNSFKSSALGDPDACRVSRCLPG
jgi:hypothetical protein